jgi:hypothetical protein
MVREGGSMTEKEIEAVIDALLANRFEYNVEAGGSYDAKEVRECAVAILKAVESARNGRN